VRNLLELLISTSLLAAGAAIGATPPKIPLCEGLTVVTAISQPEGDYESIKQVTANSGGIVQLHYSSEGPNPVRGAGKLHRLELSRTIHAVDLANAKLYLQQFQPNIPSDVPGTTAIGVSRAVLASLKTRGEAELSVFSLPPPVAGAPKMSISRQQHPNVFDSTETYKLRRVETTPVMLPVIVNDARVELPAIHAAGRSDYYGYKSEFYLLDDESNPLALKWRLGIGAGTGATAGRDRDTLQVIKIAYNCSVPTTAAARLERALAETGRADIYSVYFSFNSDEIRAESEPTLREIGEILGRHPDWKLTIGGHTDNIGGDAPNLNLSKRRANAVQNALATRFRINAGRLTTEGYGKSRPVDTNETPEGRARNRRVELLRRQ
jgi:outer membrane protein OmpA-like peptidoglycan-associated protein